jgi:hypothetical protein
MSHWSSSTVALNGVKAQGSNYSSTATYCDVVLWCLAWHNRGKRRSWRRRSCDHVAGQVGTARPAWFTPLRSFHPRGNIPSEPSTNHDGQPESMCPITGGEVHCISDLFQSTVPWRSRLARLIEQLQGHFSLIFIQRTTNSTIPKLFPYIPAPTLS